MLETITILSYIPVSIIGFLPGGFIIFILLEYMLVKKIYLFIYFRERGKEGEKHRHERETSMGCFSHVLRRGTRPATRHVP